jgi:two-component system cell cycle sensor histidine kinase/response regulator CckA
MPSDPTTWDPARFASRLLDSAGEGIVVYDRELRYRVWNRFMEARTGVAAASVIGRVAPELFPYLREEGVVDQLRRVLAGERVQSAQPRIWQSPDGAPAWMMTRFEPFVDEGGAIVGVIAYLLDITARQHAEDELRRSEALYRTIIESASDLVTILDGEGKVRYVSPAVSAVLGLQPSEVLGRNPVERIHPDDQEHIVELFRELTRDPSRGQRAQYRVRHADGSWRTLMTSARNLGDDPAVQGIVATSRDVTAWEELQARLQQSQRIEAVGRLAGGVAHDFNNLLTVIRGNAQLIMANGALPTELQEELEEIGQAAERAATLTRQLLAFSRQQVLQPRVIDLNEVVGGGLEAARAAGGRGGAAHVPGGRAVKAPSRPTRCRWSRCCSTSWSTPAMPCRGAARSCWRPRTWSPTKPSRAPTRRCHRASTCSCR